MTDDPASPSSGPAPSPVIQFSESDLQTWKDALIEINAKGHDKATAYANLIVVAGYAGAFTLWNFTRSELTPKATASVAALLSLSLAAFVIFEIYKMFTGTALVMKQRAILLRVQSSSEMYAQLKALEAEANRTTLRRLIPIWNAMFWFTVVTAFAAAVLLFYSFLATLFGWPQGAVRPA